MFKRQPDSVRKFAIFVGKNPFLKKILRPLYSKYMSSIKEHRNDLFKKNGLEVLKKFDSCLTENGFPYTLAFGSMLGAVREHGFIKHDLDMDVAMWIEDRTPRLRDCLKKSGFSLVHELSVDDGGSGLEETYICDGVTIDIFYIYPAIDQYPYTCDFLAHSGSVSFEDSMKKYGCIIPRRVQLPWKKEMTLVPFSGLSLPIPTNANEVLSFRYGEDYMIPNPHWHYTDAHIFTTIWEEKKGIMKK